jgi:hypothetical protein
LIGLFRGLWSRVRPRDDLAMLLSAAFLGGLLFFSLSEAQMGHFYGVLQPALAGLAGIGLVVLARASRWALAPVLAATAGLAALVWGRDDPSVILETATVKAHLFGVIDLTAPALIVLGLWAALAVLLALTRRLAWATAAVVPSLVLAAFLGWQAIPALEAWKSLAPIWERYEERRADGEPIAMVGFAKDSAFYYSNLRIVRVKRHADLVDYLDPPGRRFMILLERDYIRLPRERLPAGRWDVLETQHPTHVLVVFERAEEDPG